MKKQYAWVEKIDDFTFWYYIDGSGVPIFNTTRGDAKPTFEGGYFDLAALKKLLGFEGRKGKVREMLPGVEGTTLLNDMPKRPKLYIELGIRFGNEDIRNRFHKHLVSLYEDKKLSWIVLRVS